MLLLCFLGISMYTCVYIFVVAVPLCSPSVFCSIDAFSDTTPLWFVNKIKVYSYLKYVLTRWRLG